MCLKFTPDRNTQILGITKFLAQYATISTRFTRSSSSSSSSEPNSSSIISNVSSDVTRHWTPGPNRPSTWWPPKSVEMGRRVVRMSPVRFRHRPRIVLVRDGCVNRPFFTIQIKSNLAEAKQHGIEQVGSWDPFPNTHGEQLVGLNLNRIVYWIGKGAEPSHRVAELLGLAGILPVHPRSYLLAHRTRLATAKYLAQMADQAKDAQPAKSTDSAPQPDSEQSETPDPKKRPDSVWRVGNEPPWWWYYGLR